MLRQNETLRGTRTRTAGCWPAASVWATYSIASVRISSLRMATRCACATVNYGSGMVPVSCMYSLFIPVSTRRLEALTSQCHRDESVSKRESITSLSLSLLMYETLSITLALQHQLKSEEITSVVTVTACSPPQHALQHRSPGPSPVPSPASNPTPLVPPARTSRATPQACSGRRARQSGRHPRRGAASRRARPQA